MGIAEIIAMVSALITGFTGAVAVMAIKSSKKENDYNLSHKTYEEINHWYDQTLEVMKDLHTPYTLGLTLNKKQKIALLSKLSKFISRGHMYFPNKLDGSNLHKPPTFQGKSCIIRDLLILYYNIYATGVEKENSMVLNALQRSFENEMSIYLNKNRYTERIQAYDKFDVTNTITNNGKNLLTIENLEEPFVKDIICKKDLAEVLSNINIYHSTIRNLICEEQQELRQKEKQQITDERKYMEKSPSHNTLGQTLKEEDIIALSKDIKNMNEAQLDKKVERDTFIPTDETLEEEIESNNE